jgi:hypothetical protein
LDGWLTGLLDVSISRGHVSIDGSFLLLPFRSAKGLWVGYVMRMGRVFDVGVLSSPRGFCFVPVSSTGKFDRLVELSFLLMSLRLLVAQSVRRSIE